MNKFFWLYVWLMTGVVAFFCCGTASGHRPHDNITDVALSPGFASDGTAFAIVANQTLRVTRDHGGSWRFLNNGLDNVHFFTSLTISPSFQEDGIVMMASAGDGVYGSKDGGRSWQKKNQGLENLDLRLIEISPFFAEDRIILAADAEGGLYRTTDNGMAWSLYLNHDRMISSMAFLPPSGNGNVLVGDSEGALILSEGNQWKQLISNPEWGAITAVAPSPEFKEDATCWIGTEKQGIFKSINGGRSFSPSDAGLTDKCVTSLVAVQQHDGSIRLYASTWNEGFFCSIDGGMNWEKYNQGLSTDIQADAPDFLLPHFKGIEAVPGCLMLGGFDGLFMSEDRGETWRQLHTWPIGYISTLALSPVLEEGRQSAILGYGGGAYYIDDVESVDWVEDARSLTLAGIRGKRTDSGISDIAFSPSFESDHTIFAATEHELIRSEDKGNSWARVVIHKPLLFRLRSKLNYYMRRLGVPFSLRLKIAGFFPLIPGWSTYVAISPEFTKDGTVFFSTQGLGQCKSLDGGKSCSVVFDTALQVTTSMAISPAFEQDKTLFVGIREHGIFKTNDAGKTFRQIDLGSAVAGDLKLAISPSYGRDRTIFAGTGNGLFKSTDGGDRWWRIGESDLPHKGTIFSVAVSPDFSKDQTVVATVKGFGVFKSTDGGKSFSTLGGELVVGNEQLKQVLFSGRYAEDNTLFGVTAENVYQSRDGGKSWVCVRRPVRYEDVQDAIAFKGNWEKQSGGEYSDSTQMRSSSAGSTASFRFYGSGIRLIGELSPDNGMARMFLDGRITAEVSFRADERQPSIVVYELSDLSRSSHEIIVKVADLEDGTGWVAVDAFEILP